MDGPKAGSNIGIIQDPLTEQAKLVAATRPIPGGIATDLALSGDDKNNNITGGFDPSQNADNYLQRLSALRGHLAPNADRRRNKKDQIATFLTSNLIPQQSGNNRDIWQDLEEHVRDVSNVYPSVDNYVIAGGDGIYKNYPKISSNESLDPSITVPQGVWKVVVSEDRQDDSNKPVFARFGTYIGNDNRRDVKWDNSAFISSIGTLEGYLNSTHRNSSKISPEYDFFNHLPTQTADELKSGWIIKYDDGSERRGLNSSLLAEESELFKEDVFSDIFSNNSSIQINFSQKGIIEVRTSQVAVFKGRLEQVGLIPNSVTKVATNKNVTVTVVDPAHVRTTEVNVFPTTTIPNSISEISSFQNSTTKIKTEGRTFQINPTQINTSYQAFTRVPDANVDEILLPSSISPEQLFNSNFFSSNFHDSTPLIDNIYSTAYILWNSKLKTNTPLDVAFKITDLPTGQLAEAQVTSFDTHGNPDGGTILIDHNANGLGWFLDPTPFDNSEFANQNSEFSSQATPESIAYGKYDLLTTILHEMGHLYGFIEGNPGFDRYVVEDAEIGGHEEIDDHHHHHTHATFVGDNFTATLIGDHLDSIAHPHNLFNTHLAPGVRKLPSDLNIQLINAATTQTLEVAVSNLAPEITSIEGDAPISTTNLCTYISS